MAQHLTLVVERVERGRAWCRLVDALGQVIGRNVQTISAGDAQYREAQFARVRQRRALQRDRGRLKAR